MLDLSCKKNSFYLGACLGIIVFICIYGTRILDVEDDLWLIAAGDIPQHYLGWCAFRSSAWFFPLGLMENLIYPDMVSIIYTDSIPLFAIVFKLFSPVLPNTFQYFGLWGLICFALQGGLASLLMRKYTENIYICLVFALFILFSPILLLRMFIHTALAANWLILFAFCSFVYYSTFKTLRRKLCFWSCMGILCAAIHIYYVPMIAVLLCGFVGYDYFVTKKIKNMLFLIGGYIVSACLTIYLLGGFTFGLATTSSDGLGRFSSNLNAFFNGEWVSLFVPALPRGDGQYEGGAYLGCGLFLLIVFAVCLMLNKNFLGKLRRDFLIEEKYRCIALFLSTLFLAVIAIGPIVMLNERIVFQYTYPSFIETILGVFRSGGRFIWPLWYFIAFYFCRIIVIKVRSKVALVVLVAFSMIQILDLCPILASKHESFHADREDKTFIKDTVWKDISTKYKHIVFVPYKQVIYNLEEVFGLGYYGLKNGMTLNAFPIARKPEQKWAAMEEVYRKNLQNGTIDDDMLFILSPADVWQNDYSQIYLYEVDGMILGVKNPLPGKALYKVESHKLVVPLVNHWNLERGRDVLGKRIIDKGGRSFGPFYQLDAGQYMITIKGENLAEVVYVPLAGTMQIAGQEVLKNNHEIRFVFSLDSNVDGVEFVVVNVNADSVVLDSMELERLNNI